MLRDDIGINSGGICAPTGFEDLDLLPKLAKRSWLVANVHTAIEQIIPGHDELWVVSRGIGRVWSSRLAWTHGRGP